MGRVATGILIALLAATARPAHAEEGGADKGILPIPDYSGSLKERSRLTDGWGGKRGEWAEKGIQFELHWVQTLQAVADGGRDTSTEYGGSLDYTLSIDLYRMGLVPGALVKIHAESRYGESVNPISGQVLPASMDAFMPLTAPLDDDILLVLSDLTYYQFLSEKFGLLLGKINTLDSDLNEFASGRGNTQFQNFNFILNATLALLPYSTLAVGGIWLPNKQVTVQALFFNTTDASTTSGFDDFGDGWSFAAQGSFQYVVGDLPGGTNVGFTYSGDNMFVNFDKHFTFVPGEGIAPNTNDDTWSIYASGWQYLRTHEEAKGPLDLMDGRPDLRGFGVFWRLGFSDDETNPVEWAFSAGLGGRGIIPCRENDTFGLGYFYTSIVAGRITGILGIDDNTQGFEFFYNFAVTPAADVTFDVQILESAAPNVDTAVVVGGRVMLRF